MLEMLQMLIYELSGKRFNIEHRTKNGKVHRHECIIFSPSIKQSEHK